MRPAVEQLIRQGYPIKTIDIDQEPKLRAALPCRQRSDVHRGRRLRTRARPHLRPAAGSRACRFYKAAAAKAQPPANSNRPRRHRLTMTGDGTATTMTKPNRRDKTSAEQRQRSRRRRSRAVRTGFHQSQAVGNRRPDSGSRQPLNRLRLGHDHLQHARGVTHSHLCAHLQA